MRHSALRGELREEEVPVLEGGDSCPKQKDGRDFRPRTDQEREPEGAGVPKVQESRGGGTQVSGYTDHNQDAAGLEGVPEHQTLEAGDRCGGGASEANEGEREERRGTLQGAEGRAHEGGESQLLYGVGTLL